MSALAFNVDDYVYTKVGKYKITGSENLVANGEFTDGSTEGWMATDEVNYPLESVFAPVEHGGVQVLPGLTALDAGMHQAVRIWAGGTYVVTFKVKGTTAGFTDHDMTGAATNYINAYYNTDGALASVDNTTLLFGENGVNGGYQFDFGTEDFTEVCFAVNAPMEGNIMIDFRGLAEGLIIKDVECYTAEEVYDDRIAINRIAYFYKYLGDGDFDDKEYTAELYDCIDAVEEAIANAAPIAEMATYMENLENCWALFADANLSNMIDYIVGKDGQVGTGYNSANWMYWNKKHNKLSSEYNGQAPWTWSTDRWSHKTAAANSPLQIQWQRKVSMDWNNIATLTTTLTPGTYYWGVTGLGGMMTLNKNRWVRSLANECANTQLFFNGDTTEVFVLNAARTEDYVYRFELTEEKEVTLGIICNNPNTTDGFDVAFYNPVLYKVLGEGLSPEEEAYINIVNDQLELLKARINVANEYLSDANTTLTWGKEALREGTNLAQERYDEWVSYTENDILGWYYNEESLADTIMNNGVRFLNNNYINAFIAMNKPLTDMPGTIAYAWETLNKRIYSSSSKKDEYEALIVASEDLYEAMLKSEYSKENAAALIAQKAALETMAEEFKVAINATTIVDIDFGTQDAPAQFNVHQDGDTLEYYTIEGAKGTMTFTDITGSYSYALGWGSATDETTGAVIATDSLGMLRVGNSEAVVNLEGLTVGENTIVNIQFDLYAGNFIRHKIGYKVLSAEDDTICGLFYSPYDGNDDMNTFGIDYIKLPKVGSSSASNSAIAAASNKTHFDIVLDYGTKTMYCTTISSKGTATSEVIALPESVPAKFVLYSNYNNADRRCWFDNLKIQYISTEGATPSDPITPEPILPNGYVYTKVGKYITTGENLVNNGQFADGSIEGWMATDEVNYPLEGVFAPVEDGGVQVLPGQTALAAGMYQAVRIDAGGTYVVSFKVKGATAGFTDHDMTGASTNYINAYYNTDGALASVDGTNLLFGENGVNGGYQFDFGAEDFTEVYFAVNAPMEGNIMIDFRGLAEGLIIKDVECYAAEEVYDDRIALNRIEYFKRYLEGNNFEGKEYYTEFQGYVKTVEAAIAANASSADMATHMENLEDAWTLFVNANFSNVLDLIPTKDGSANTGNNSANWMNWTSKWNKLNSDYRGKAPWAWSTDRWGHKTAAVNTPMAIQWMRGAGANSNWNNVATLTATLSPGIYYWGVSGQGGMFTLNKNRWARSWADECAETKLFFNGDTVLVGILNAARNEDYVVQFKLEEEKEVTLGIICNNVSSSEKAGFDVQFFSPVLYKVLEDNHSPKFYAMYAQDVEAAESSTVNIPIVMDNSMPISAFQFDLYLPIGVTPVYNIEDGEVVYDITLDGARSSSSHVVTASQQPDGALRIVAYSAKNECFKGNEGVLVDVAVKIAKGVAVGDYPMMVRNARMVEVDVTEYKAADHTATFTVVRGFIMGDVNSDEQHTMADVVMLVNAVLNIAQANYNADVADMNGDGIITMADVVLVLRLVLGYDQVAATRSMAREASAVAIETGNVVTGSNGEIILPVYMNGKSAYTAFQMDVVLPEGMSLTNATLGGRGKSSHSIAWSTLDNGAVRIVAFAMDNATFNDNAEALVYLTLKAETAIADDAVLTLTEGLFATVNGSENRADNVVWRAGEETTGINGVAASCRIYGTEGAVVVENATDATVTVYTVTGQLVQQAQVKAGKTNIVLPAGVYVVNGYKVPVR